MYGLKTSNKMKDSMRRFNSFLSTTSILHYITDPFLIIILELLHLCLLWFQIHLSQVLSQIVYLIQDEVQVLPADLGADDHHPEKVGFVSVGLVAYHHAACLHHSLLYHRGHLQAERRYCSDLLLFHTDDVRNVM